MTSPVHLRPMDLTEIRLHVGSYLSGADHKACAIVCKAWHRDFQSLVWKSLNARRSLLLSLTQRKKWLSSVRANAHWVRHLLYPHDTRDSEELDFILLNRCRSLQSIVMSAKGLVEWQKLNKLVSLNSSVSHVLVDRTTTFEFHNHSSVRVEVKRSYNQDTDTNDLTNQAPQPGRFTRTLPENMAVDRLLAVIEEAAAEAEEDAHGHQGYWYGQDETTDLRPTRTLRLVSTRSDDGPLVSLVNAIPKHCLKEATLFAEDPNIFRALIQRQHQRLERLSGSTPGWPHHDVVSSILEQCSKLQVLDLRLDQPLDIRAILNGPWACTEIEEMTLPLDIDPDCNDRALLDIAYRHKLEIHPYRDEHEQAELVFVYLLRAMKNLRRVDFGALSLNSHPVMRGFWPQDAPILRTIPTQYREVDY
ncbi:hypothetical protein DFQ26_003506 [Actinomortierella ambigua]|nr:hypothetical protein DFQ26_003506 [Actinomortierella ambigua]